MKSDTNIERKRIAIERNQKAYDRFIRKVRPVLIRRFGSARTEKIIRDAGLVYTRFLEETPSIGGKANVMNKNMDVALSFFSVYEASGRKIGEADIDEMLDIVMVQRIRKVGWLINMNRLDKPWFRKLAYRVLRRIADQSNARKGKEWNNTWGIQVNPEGHENGLAMTLVDCPLADFARAHGYMDVLPRLCAADMATAEAMHARLIRHHTVAQGYKTCDYWYVGDQNTEAR